MFKPANKSTLHDDVLAQMLDAIANGTWTPGSRLPGEQALATQFEVSRNCIREVLKALALSGVVEAHAGSGTFLSPNALRNINGNRLIRVMLDETSLNELIEVRCLVEGQVAYWAAERATDEEIAELGYILTTSNLSDIDSHTAFHQKLHEMGRNKLLYRFLESIRGELEFSRQHYSQWTNELLEKFVDWHFRIYESIKARDAEGSRQHMINHILAAWGSLAVKVSEADKKTDESAVK